MTKPKIIVPIRRVEPEPRPKVAEAFEVDWRAVGRSALGSAIIAGIAAGTLHMLASYITAERRRAAEREEAERVAEEAADRAEQSRDDDVSLHDGDDDDEAEEAALLLGVSLEASEKEIRAALRTRLLESRLHPDHGGKHEETVRLIAARDLLVERARAVQS